MRAGRAPLLDFKHLRSGQVYRVRRTFLDAHRREHRVGEEWTYLSRYQPEDATQITLLVRDAEGHRQTIPLRASVHAADDVVDRLHVHLSRVPEVVEGHQFLCDCELGSADWAEVYGSSRHSVIECFECGMVVAVQRVEGASRMLSLDNEARAAVRTVSSLPANAPFEALLHAAVEHRTFPANVMLGTMLARRPNLEQEFADALRSDERSLRLVALEFVSQMSGVPEGLEPYIMRALQSPLDPDPLGDETRWALEAALHVADRATDFRSEIAELRRALRRYKTEEARRSRALVQAILAKMDERIRTTEHEREAAIAVLRRLATEKEYVEALRWLDDWTETHRDGHGLLVRANLAEAAGDGLADEHPEAARWLYERALNLYEQYATGRTVGEGAARRRHVRRVGRKLGHPLSSLPPPPERHAIISSSSLRHRRLPSEPEPKRRPAPPEGRSAPKRLDDDLLTPEIEVGRAIPVDEEILALAELAEAEAEAEAHDTDPNRAANPQPYLAEADAEPHDTDPCTIRTADAQDAPARAAAPARPTPTSQRASTRPHAASKPVTVPPRPSPRCMSHPPAGPKPKPSKPPPPASGKPPRER
jgi:hypothetical protein